MKLNLIKIFHLTLFFLLPNFSKAAVIFETNFDSNPDWNVAGQYEGNECSVVGIVGSTSTCASNTYPVNWDAYRAMPALNYPAFHPTVQIGHLPSLATDHTGAGKAMTVYNESYPAYPNSFWPGDGMLVKYFNGNTYSDLNVQLWMKTQPGWQWASSGAKAIKFFRTQFWPAANSLSKNIFQMTESTPSMIFDMGNWQTWLEAIPSYRCDMDDYYCANSPNNYQKSDNPLFITQNSVNKYDDGAWHKWNFHLKMNTPGQNDGIFTVKLDNNILDDHGDVVWRETGSTVAGWSHIMLGGNSYNDFATQADQWYAIDDVVVSTTQIPDNYVIGSGSSDTIAPSAPTGLSVL